MQLAKLNGLTQAEMAKVNGLDLAQSTPLDSTYAVMLLHMDGADGSTTFTDATGRHTMTAAGDAQVDDAQAVFSQSLLCDGTGDYVYAPTSADFSAGAGEFCLDLWVRPTTLSGDILGVYTGAWFDSSRGNFALNYLSPGVYRFLYLGATAAFIDISGIAVNTWTHVAICRQGDTLRGYSGGVHRASASASGITMNSVATPFTIGLPGYTGASGLIGNLDELCLVKGIARVDVVGDALYCGGDPLDGFTPPAAPYTLA